MGVKKTVSEITDLSVRALGQIGTRAISAQSQQNRRRTRSETMTLGLVSSLVAMNFNILTLVTVIRIRRKALKFLYT